MLGWFAETTIVAALLAVVAIVGCRIRPSSPSIRHALWLVVLIKLITPPLVAWPWAVRISEFPWPEAPPRSVAADVPGEQSLQVPPAVDPEPLDADINETAFVRRDSDRDSDCAGDETEPALVAASSEVTPVEPAPAVAGSETTRGSWTLWASLPTRAAVERSLFSIWLAMSVVLGIGQAIRIIRFRRRLRQAQQAPADLVAEALQIGWQLGVSVPKMRVVPELGTPMLWCLGRPLLLLPEPLVKTLPVDRWRGILTHELAHLRRGDHWVSRIELAAGLFWWWNPLYWLTRARLDSEAELACDAWVVSTLPKDRLTYAEVLFDICATLSQARPALPTLGVAGSGRFFERRLTMILHDHVRCRLSPLALVGAALLALFALPSWLVAKPSIPAAAEETAVLSTAPAFYQSPGASTGDDDDDQKAAKRDKNRNDDDDDANDADDDDDDDDDKAAARAKAEAQVEAAKANLEAAKANLEAAKARANAEKAKADASKAKAPKVKAKAKELEEDFDFDVKLGPEFEKAMEALGKEIESKFGPEFEKKMEALGEQIQSKFGPEFDKKMEALGKDIEAKFGPEFEKKMEALGKEIEAKLGPDSEFAEKMEALGKELGEKFGPDSEFAEKMKSLGEELGEKFGPDSEFAKKLKEKAAAAGGASTSEKRSSQPSDSARGDVKSKPKFKIVNDRRVRRIRELEAQIKKLMDEVKALEKSGDQDDDDDTP